MPRRVIPAGKQLAPCPDARAPMIAFSSAQHLKTSEQLEATIAEFDVRLEAALAPFREAIERLKGVPGVSDNVAQTLIAEIGADMSTFDSRSSCFLGRHVSAP